MKSYKSVLQAVTDGWYESCDAIMDTMDGAKMVFEGNSEEVLLGEVIDSVISQGNFLKERYGEDLEAEKVKLAIELLEMRRGGLFESGVKHERFWRELLIEAASEQPPTPPHDQS